MKIEIQYLLLGSDKPSYLAPKPEDYFDPVEHDENFWDDGVEKNIFPHEHIGIEPSKLKWLIIRQKNGSNTRITRNQYLDGDDSMMTHTKDEFGAEEIIYSRKIGDAYEIVRILKPTDQSWSVTYNVIASDVKTDDIYPTDNLTKNWSFDELKDFCNNT